MNKKLIRGFYLVGLALGLVAAPLIVFSFMGSTFSQQIVAGHSTLVQIGHLPLFILGVVIAVLASALIVIAWLGALYRVAQLQRWGWFIGLLVFAGVGLLAYVIADPETRELQPGF